MEAGTFGPFNEAVENVAPFDTVGSGELLINNSGVDSSEGGAG